jgi:hypothetical protein
MEISEVKRRLQGAIDRARREAAGRRVRADAASREYAVFLDTVAVPLFRQIANVLRTAGYSFTVFTPAGSVRLMSDKSAEDYIELWLDTAGSEPVVIGKVSRGRGRRVVESEHPVADAPVGELSEEQLLEFVLKELGPFVER